MGNLEKRFTQVRRLFLCKGFILNFPAFLYMFRTKAAGTFYAVEVKLLRAYAWKHSPYSKLSEIGWKMSSGSHKYLSV